MDKATVVLDKSEISKLPEIFNIQNQEWKSYSVNQKIDYLKSKGLPKIYGICFIGHVDAGKSTTCGRLLYDCKRLTDRQMNEYEVEADKKNMSSFKFAYVMDKTKAEREKGVTIECGLGEFQTPKGRYMTIVDAPGHTDFIKNMVVGVNQADIAIMVVDAKTGTVDRKTGELKEKTTQQHLAIARAGGCKSVIVLLNKLNLVPHSERESLYNERVEQINALLNKTFFRDQSRKHFIPVNSLEGWNIADTSMCAAEYPFYKGPSLVEALDSIPIDDSAFNPDLPVRISIEDTHSKIGGTQIVTVGKMFTGCIVPEMTLVAKPTNTLVKVKGIQMHYKNCGYMSAGGFPALALISTNNVKLTDDDFPKGTVLSVPNSKDTAKNVVEFTCERAFIRAHPTKLAVGSQLIAHFHCGSRACSVVSLGQWINKTQCVDIKAIEPGKFCRITLRPMEPIVVDTASENPRTSKVLFRDCQDTIGFGSIDSYKLHPDEVSITTSTGSSTAS